MPIKTHCAYCGKEITRSPSRINEHSVSYCSKACRGRASTSLVDGKRQCTGCGRWFPATTGYFAKQGGTSLGLKSQCRECASAKRAAWQSIPENRARVNARNRAWRKANPDRLKALKAASYVRNRESAIEKSRAWRAKNPRRLSSEKERVKGRIRLERKRMAPGVFTRADVAAQLEKQQRKCFYCDCALDAYQVDHRVPLARGGSNYPENIVLACPECNLVKGNRTDEEFRDYLLPILLKRRGVQ